ncbi:MAG TPA: DUF721 domain-containing protein [Bacteroidetes bacterium]|nr:DUF721 domain-containing protein [Bacteroidota bacterium]
MPGNGERGSSWDGWHRERVRKGRRDSGSGAVLSIAAALSRWVESTGRGARFAEAQLLADWEKIVGESVAKHAKPLRLERGRLVLGVTDPVWRHQLFFMREELVGKLNRSAGRKLVREIVLTGA